MTTRRAKSLADGRVQKTMTAWDMEMFPPSDRYEPELIRMAPSRPARSVCSIAFMNRAMS